MRKFYNILMTFLIVLACSNIVRLEAQNKTDPIKSRPYSIDGKTISLVYRVGVTSGSASFNPNGALSILFDTKTTKAQFFVEFQKLEYAKDKERFYDDYKLVIAASADCVSDNSNNITRSDQELLSLEWSKTKKEFSALSLNLTVRNKTTKTDNISGLLVIKFRILSSATDCVRNPPQCKCASSDYSLSIPFEIDNVISEERRDWLNVKDLSLADWCKFLSAYPGGQFADDAIEKISRADNELWINTNKGHKKSLEDYIKNFNNCGNYVPIHKDEAEKLLKKPITQSPKPVTPKDNWNEVLKADNLAEYQAYLNNNPGSPHQTEAEEAIRRLSPITWEWEEGDEGYQILHLQNVKRVQFKDVSTGGKLAVIDTSALLGEHILRIKFDIGNKYKLKIEDREWKKVTIIEFDRAYTPKFTAEQSVFQFAMKGGIAPFRLALRDAVTKDTLWSVGDIQEDEYNLKKADLLKYIQTNPNLCGLDTLTLEPLIWESEVFEPQVMAGGSFQLPVNLRSCVNWLQWTITGLVIVITGLLFSIFFIVRRRRNSPKTTFDRR